MSLLRKWNKIKTAELDEHRNIKNDRIRKIEQKLRLNNIQENVEYEENTFVEKFSSDEIITVESEEDDDYANMITGENKENHIKIYENIAYNIFGSVENNKKIVDRKSRYPTRRFEEETEMTDMENEGINMPIKRMKTVETYPVFGEWSFKNVGRLTSCYHHINKSFFWVFQSQINQEDISVDVFTPENSPKYVPTPIPDFQRSNSVPYIPEKKYTGRLG